MTRARRVVAVAALLVAAVGPIASGQALRASGRHFVDRQGRVVLLRGINLAGDSKVPPFVPVDHPSQLDPLPALGFNCVRLVFNWEAFEPRPGGYDDRYLAMMRGIASECGARGMFVVVDVHQDGFSRFLAKGAGDGFPPWAASPRARLYRPDNGPGSRDWPIRMVLDPGMHRSFADFYSDANGVRARYLAMLRRVAGAFAAEPMTIGYDLLNEPWGRERSELAPLYEDAARAVRSEHPGAILFVEGHISTNTGLPTKLPRPSFDNVAYAPHYYKPAAILGGTWRRGTATMDVAFRHMRAKADAWDVPLFLGEFGAPALMGRSGDYVAALYDRLDEGLSSGAQWNYTPHWNPRDKDRWNGEDFNILDLACGRTRPNFRPRPYPRAVAGVPCSFLYREGPWPVAELHWDSRPDRGDTEVFLPRCVFGDAPRIGVGPEGASWSYDRTSQVLSVRAGAGMTALRVDGGTSPPSGSRPTAAPLSR